MCISCEIHDLLSPYCARHVVLHLHVPRAAAQDHGETDCCAKAEEGDHLLHGRAVIYGFYSD